MAVLPTGIGPVTGYQIERSLRFNSADLAYLNRTPASAGNRKTWTWSGWVKRSALGSAEYLFAAGTGATDTTQQGLNWNADNTLRWTGQATIYLVTTQVFRDPSAWYHIVLVFDTTQATANNRQRLYINGVEITAFNTQVNPTQNLDYAVNQAAAFNIGRWTGASNYFNGYMTEVNFVDSPVLVGSTTNASTTVTLTTGTTANIGIGWNVGGTNIPSGATVSSITNSTQFVISSAATGTGSSISIGVTPPVTAFGETDSATGVWTPKAWTGTYGTNGFYLKFADNSGTTSTTLGKDSSGNSNNWTPNNFSVTAGTGNDSLVDTPTSYGTDTGVGGEVRGNYATWNPLKKNTNITQANGNLDVSGGSASSYPSFASIAMSTGKWYWENLVNTNNSAAYPQFGVVDLSVNENTAAGLGATKGIAYCQNADIIKNGSTILNSSTIPTFTNGDVISVAYDADTGKVWFAKNGTWVKGASGNTGNPAAGTNEVGTVTAETQGYVAGGSALNTASFSTNFGQRAFAYTAPSGFKALCTQNLPTPTIGATSTTQANKYFDATLYAGTSATQSITNSGSMQPDLIWTKNRSGAFSHNLTDSVRGGSVGLTSNGTNAEYSINGITFNSNGFTLTDTTSQFNATGSNYVGWQWNAGGSNQTISVGQYATSPANVPSIASTVRANTTSGFSIVQWSGSAANATVGHGLGATPSFIMVKDKSSGTNGGAVYHTSMGATKYLKLFQTTTGSDAEATDNTAWNGSSPTFNTNVFSVGSLARTNASGTSNMIAYCFAPVAGYSAFGSYTGNVSADGPFVYLGFRPAYVLIKRSSASESWCLMDYKREGYNVDNDPLFPNLSNAEGTQDFLDLLSNGFKLRSTDTGVNGSGTYIYAAFAESPFKYSLAR